MKKVIVASKSLVKINAVKQGFEIMFPEESFEYEGVRVSSGVSEQPMTDDETYAGARQRAENASQEIKEADFWVGIEGGVDKKDEETSAFSWVLIKSKDNNWGKGKTGTFFLPKKISDKLLNGERLNDIDNKMFNRNNSDENGVIGLLTGNFIDRTKSNVFAVVLALIPFKNEKLYFE